MIAAGVIAVAVGALFGYGQDKVLWQPLRHRGTGLIAMMIVSIGFGLFLRSIYQYTFGGSTRSLDQYTTQVRHEWGPIHLAEKEIAIILVSVVVIAAVCIAMVRTRFGKALRAVSDNPALSASSGMRVDGVIRNAWILGTALSALSGVLLAVNSQVKFDTGFKMLLLVFAAVTLGGLGTIWGALFGLHGDRHRRRGGADLRRPVLHQGGRRPGGAHPHPADQAARHPRPPRADRVEGGHVDFLEILRIALQQAFGPTAIVFVLAAIGLNVHFGYTGLLNFGQSGFMAVGAYGLAVAVVVADLPFWVGIFFAFLAPLVLAIVLGLPTLRLRADYLAIATIAAAEILRLIFGSVELKDTFGGSNGLTGYSSTYKDMNPYSEGIDWGFIRYSRDDLWNITVGWTLVAISCLIVRGP